MKLTIYHGAKTPMKATGKHQCRLLEFAERFHGWHSYKTTCRATRRAIEALQRKGYIELNAFDQFRIAYPD